MRRGRHPRGICPVCGREYGLRWCQAEPGWTMRRHGWPDICDGSGCGPARVTLDYSAAKAAAFRALDTPETP